MRDAMRRELTGGPVSFLPLRGAGKGYPFRTNGGEQFLFPVLRIA